MGVVNEGGTVERPYPFVSAEFDRFMEASLYIEGVSPMDRALKIAEAIGSASMRASLLPRIGDMKGSIYWHRKTLEHPEGLNARVVLESLISMIDRDGDTTIDEAADIRREWWQAHGLPLVAKQRPHTNDRNPDRPLRVGYVSANFKHSSAGNCLEAIVLRHSEAVQPVCYNTNRAEFDDPITQVFQLQTEFVNVAGLSEAELAARVRADRIDILIDCMGFTYGNRLGTFCERPAPIQATGWGYATGTVPAMDVILLDPITAGADRFAERVANLPCVISYAWPAMWCPDVRPRLTPTVNFGALHCFIKINPEVLAAWRRILDRVPGSVVTFKGKEYGEASLRASIEAQLGGRCVFLPQSQQMEHLDTFNTIDLVLDPWPQTGGITTCEALQMGVPSVTLMGPRTIQRAAAAILDLVGFHEGLTATVDAYVDRAVELVTTRREWLTGQRFTLRDRLQTSKICRGYPEAVETLFRKLWRRWCLTAHPYDGADYDGWCAQCGYARTDHTT